MGELFLYILTGFASRMLPHPSNMTAIGALAVYSGARRGVLRGMAVVFGAMFVSDMFLGFHPLMYATYGSFFLTVCIGRMVAGSRKIPVIAGSIAGSALLFYLMTNFAVWQQGLMYPHTPEGLIACYVAGLPFLRNSLIGDMAYGAVFFGAEAIGKEWNRKMMSLRAVSL